MISALDAIRSFAELVRSGGCGCSCGKKNPRLHTMRKRERGLIERFRDVMLRIDDMFIPDKAYAYGTSQRVPSPRSGKTLNILVERDMIRLARDEALRNVRAVFKKRHPDTYCIPNPRWLGISIRIWENNKLSSCKLHYDRKADENYYQCRIAWTYAACYTMGILRGKKGLVMLSVKNPLGHYFSGRKRGGG